MACFRFKKRMRIYKRIILPSLWGMRHMQQVSHHMLIFLTLLPDTIKMKLLDNISCAKNYLITGKISFNYTQRNIEHSYIIKRVFTFDLSRDIFNHA